MAMTINERFDMIITDLYGGNKSAFASAIGVTPSVVDNIVGKRQGKPSFDVVEKVSALAEVNVQWLITGIGEAFTCGDVDNPPQHGYSNGLELKLLDMLSKKDDIIRRQAEEIGQLREQVRQFKLRLEKTAGDVNIGDTANVG